MRGGSPVSLNLEDLRVLTDARADHPVGYGEPVYEEVTESEIIGLAVQLLKERGARTIEAVDIDMSGWMNLPLQTPASYLLVPLSILGEQ